MRTLSIDNTKIVDHHKNLQKLIKEGQDIHKKNEEYKDKLHKKGLEIQKVKDKVNFLLKEELADSLEEFEYVGQLEIKQGKVELKIHDQIEEQKKAIREKREEEKQK